MACHACGCQAPTKYVEFHQNIGAFIMRFPKAIKGNLCKRCINEYFWKYTLTTAAIGWLGLISLIVTPIFITQRAGVSAIQVELYIDQKMYK